MLQPSKEAIRLSFQTSTQVLMVLIVLGLAAFGLFNLLPILVHLLLTAH